jgi:hypothetical protein
LQKDWGEYYQREKTASNTELNKNIEDFIKEFRDKVIEIGNEDFLKVIEVLGSSKFDNVHYPTIEGQNDEGENFKWFVANDVGSGSKNRGNRIEPIKESLKPIVHNQVFPVLKEHPFED